MFPSLTILTLNNQACLISVPTGASWDSLHQPILEPSSNVNISLEMSITKLIQPDITAIALTGIGGVGKSTLAALLYRYVDERRSGTHTSLFPS